MYSNISNKINEIIKNNPPEAVLFSGGIDSSCILYESKKYNKNVIAITVGVKENENSDVLYSQWVADKMEVDLKVYVVDRNYILSKIDEAIKIMKTFNPEWISSTVTLLLGIEYAKKIGINSIASGEGSDDLFASFPFFLDYKGSKEELDKLVNVRLKNIDVMTTQIANYFNLKSLVPFRDKEIEKIITSIPIQDRQKQTNNIKTKYPLRICYENFLPEETIYRPQTMAFKGSGIYDIINSISLDVTDEEFEDASSKIFKFKNKLEYALYKKYIKMFDFKQTKENNCVHCKSSIDNESVNCKVCQTIQINGKELFFNGE